MKILIIDDNDELCKLLSDYFALHNDKCTIINSCKNGLSAIHTIPFDVILYDVRLDDCNELCLIDILEKEGILKKSNVVIFTESNIPHSEIELLLKRGVREVLRKPVNADILYTILHRISKNQD